MTAGLPTFQALLHFKAGYVLGQGSIDGSRVHCDAGVQQVRDALQADNSGDGELACAPQKAARKQC